MHFKVEVDCEDDGRWIAEVAELPGVHVYGNSAEQAQAKAQALALRAYATDRFTDADGQNGLAFHRDDKGSISAVTLLLAGGEREARPANWRLP